MDHPENLKNLSNFEDFFFTILLQINLEYSNYFFMPYYLHQHSSRFFVLLSTVVKEFTLNYPPNINQHLKPK